MKGAAGKGAVRTIAGLVVERVFFRAFKGGFPIARRHLTCCISAAARHCGRVQTPKPLSQ